MAALQNPVDVAEYLFRRLAQLGIRSIFGVPGDYNLVALDYIPTCGLSWVGSVNELNAGYSADGYARIAGIGALVTTFGVGELSALNAVAGAYSEFVPVVHVVGTPSTISQEDGLLLHHTLGDGNFSVFTDMSKAVCCFTVCLDRKVELIQDLIDNALRECYLKSRPVYIALPTDVVQCKVEGIRLDSPLDLEFPSNNLEEEDFIVEEIWKLLQQAQNPTILVDACAIRHRAIQEVHELVTKSGLPTFVAPMGKGAVDETLPNYIGVYAGDGSPENVKSIIEASDLVLSIGAIKSDFNTTGFSYRTSQLIMVEFHSGLIRIKYAEYHGIRMNGVLRKIAARITHSGLENRVNKNVASPDLDDEHSMQITHAWFWPQLTSWFKENDIIITETGTSGYGIWETKFQPKTSAINQTLWGSIGYATGAAAGAAFAAKERGSRRTILFTGDGSFQLTVQELRFTIERFIHGMEAEYNNIANWNYKELVSAFGGQPGTVQTYSVQTRNEVETLLADEDFASAQRLRFVELVMDPEDAPLPLKLTAARSAENNANKGNRV